MTLHEILNRCQDLFPGWLHDKRNGDQMSLLTHEEIRATLPGEAAEWATEDEVQARREEEINAQWEEWYASADHR